MVMLVSASCSSTPHWTMAKYLFFQIGTVLVLCSQPLLCSQPSHKGMEDVLNFIVKFYNESVVDLISNSTAHEDKSAQEPLDINKRSEENYYNKGDNAILLTNRNFPVNDYMANAMLSFLGEGGVLDAGGFYREGFILKDGSANIMCLKHFGNRTKLLNQIQQARNAPLAVADGLAVVMQVLLSNSDFHGMVNWLKGQIKMKGDLNYEKPCSPTLVIRFYCCTGSGSLIFGPKFGTLIIGIE